MVLKPQDILVLLKLVTVGDESWSYHRLASELGMSPSEVHAAVKRALAARLALEKDGVVRPLTRNLLEFLLHGLKFVFVPERGGMSRGMPTAHAAAPLAEQFMAGDEPPPVWPDPKGEVRGLAFTPLYKSVPEAARNDPMLYELLVLVDAVRGGRVREQNIAAKELNKRMESYGKDSEPQS